MFWCCFLILSIITILYLVCRLLLLKKALREAARELLDISLSPVENRVLKMAVPEKELEALLTAINQNLEVIRQEQREYQKTELQLKEQIENISHDLRTPLTAVLGFLKMIDASQLSAQDQEYLSIAVRKSHTLQHLIARFYELSCVTAESFQLTLLPVDATRILKESCLENYALFEKAQIQVEMPPFTHPVVISGDGEALRRIFSNLIQNSIRYAKSKLIIEVKQSPESGSVQFLFTNDIEPGQEVADPSRLFDRFYMQEHSRHRGGTGLGLTISKSLAGHMNGTMEAVYSGEEGARFLTFTLTFPTAAALPAQ